MAEDTFTEDDRTETQIEAAHLEALALHLYRHPELPLVSFHPGHQGPFPSPPDLWLQPDGVPGLLAWIASLPDPDVSITVQRGTRRTQIVAKVRLAGHEFEITGKDLGDISAWTQPAAEDDRLGRVPKVSVTLEQLQAYAAAGTVEGVPFP